MERATREIGGPIAHGYLTLSLIPFLGSQILHVTGVTRGINYGSNKVRFTGMVRVGKRVRMRQKLLSAEPKSGGLQLTNECTIEIEGEERPACVAERDLRRLTRSLGGGSLVTHIGRRRSPIHVRPRPEAR